MIIKCFGLFLVVFLHNVAAQIAVYELKVANLHKMQTGIGWPHSLHVAEGHEALLKLASSLENYRSCEVLTPAGLLFDVQDPPSDRYESWTEADGCGVRVKNISHPDEGRWRLTAVRGNDSITGWTELHVAENINEYHGSPIVLHNGQTHAQVNLTTLSNSYCLVAQPFTDRTLVPGHCSVTLDRTTRAVQGNWHVLLGLPGMVSELPVDTSVTVESERLEAGFIHGENKLHMYCNLLHTEKNITFCRFQQSNAQSGYNIVDGLSDGSHSYYGEGFAEGQCGMTVERPTPADYGTWRCTVGVQEWTGGVIEQRTPLQAIIRVTGGRTRDIQPREDTERTLFVQEDMSVTIHCAAEASLSYCWFQHPNGTQFAPVPKADDNQLFWYSGKDLSVGDCSITFAHVHSADGGVWTCHMGPRDRPGVEATARVRVTITGPLAATDKIVTSVVGENATLYCHTSNGNRPLDYCRFLSPSLVGIRVDASVTKANPILGRFYFTPARDLNYGDCSLTIDPVMEEDMGEWTCAALVDDEILESRDTINLIVQDTPRFRAGIVGMSVGLSVLFLLFGGVMVYKYGDLAKLRSRVPWRRNTNTTDAMSLEMRTETGTRLSTGSGGSGGSNSSNEQAYNTQVFNTRQG